MINSISSDLQNTILWNKLAAAKAAEKEAAAVQKSSADKTDTTDSAVSDNGSTISMEDIIRMMASTKKTVDVSANESSTKSDTSSDSYDTDGDGSISADEYEAAVSALGISNAESSEDFFEEYDTDNDGEISTDELNANKPKGMPPMGPPPKDDESETNHIDTDNDGTISADEYEAAIENAGITDAPSAEDIFAQFDTNGDGELSAEEIKAGSAQESTASTLTDTYNIDTDEDGTISADEYDAAVDKLGISDAPDSEEIFSRFDTNKDGEITADEIAAQEIKLAQSMSAEYQNYAAKALNAYEVNYQYMYENDEAETDSIA